ncbi:MAG: hypothetical protein MMC33_007291 [Icmadophila ericetorum]|nr:hypothetical protein [Icmadophila ericetorum]
MTTTNEAQAGPSSFTTTGEDVSVEGRPSIPILLLKTLSKPDAYLSHFTTATPSSSSSGLKFSPTFIPVLRHSFVRPALDTLRTLLLNQFTSYSGLIFTSQRAVEAFAHVVENAVLEDMDEERERMRVKLRELKLPFYTVGPATSRSLEAIRDEHFPLCTVEGKETGNGAGLAAYILLRQGGQMPQEPSIRAGQADTTDALIQDSSGTTATEPSPTPLPLLFLVGEQRRDIIPKILMSPSLAAEQRIAIEEMIVYETSVMESFAIDFRRVLSENQVSELIWIVVFSPTGCEAMLKVLGWLKDESSSEFSAYEGLAGPKKTIIRKEDVNQRTRVYLATIGPTTRDYLREEFGCEVDVCAKKPSPEGVGRGVEGYMREHGLI